MQDFANGERDCVAFFRPDQGVPAAAITRRWASGLQMKYMVRLRVRNSPDVARRPPVFDAFFFKREGGWEVQCGGIFVLVERLALLVVDLIANLMRMLSSGHVRSRASTRALRSLRSSSEPKYVSALATLYPAMYEPSMRTITLSRKSRTCNSMHTAGAILLFSCFGYCLRHAFLPLWTALAVHHCLRECTALFILWSRSSAL